MSTSDTRGKTPSPSVMPAEIERAVEAAQAKKAVDLVVLDLRSLNGFTDYFVICSGQSQRQVKAIAEAVEESLAKSRLKPAHIEGSGRADWILLDYFDFVVHIFNPNTRAFYGLERLWGSAERLEVVDVDRRPPIKAERD
jgi:ribosome-associated protein